MKKLTILMLVVVMVLGLMLLAVGASDPVNKVTGEIWLFGGGGLQHLVFDVHDREGEDKGYIYWYGPDDDVVIVEPYRTSPVLCCNFINENTAWFAYGPDPERDELEYGCLVFKVVDGGSPGADCDKMYAEPLYDPKVKGREDDACKMVAKATKDLLEATIEKGNLVVHYYE